ncbi:MAG: arylsulfatase [Bacteroidales bacterium]|nr:arylsulfatase [Bacteroidales bacterium]
MKRTKRFLLPLLCFPLLCLLSACSEADPERPNIIIIMSDDMGYSDLGCYGGEIRTPTLDDLAANGLRFTQFYNTGRCCPTRASLLSGVYPHQASIGHMMGDDKLPGYRGELGKDVVTIAEVMGLNGYSCYMSGKWHVTPDREHIPVTDSMKHNWPLQRGFDRFYGTIHGAGSFWDPNTLTRDNEYVTPDADPEYSPEHFYYTDAISDHAMRYIKEHDDSQPFFMYVAYTAAHWPMHCPEDEIEKYDGVYDEGYGAIREARYKRSQEMGLINSTALMSAQFGDWEAVKHRDWELRCMETYAAMVTRMDAGIGRIVEALKEEGELENTLILFLQDNGGCQEELGRYADVGLDAWESIKNWGTVAGSRPDGPTLPPMKPGELQTRMVPVQTRDGYPVRMGPEAMPGPADTYIAYGEAWANVSNTPFRMYKHFVHEGGIATPLIACWPAGITDHGALRYTPSHLIDLMATCGDLGGGIYPEEYKGHSIQPMEGMSLVPVFDSDKLPERHLLWEHEGNAAIRQGDWKLVGRKVMDTDSTLTEKWELYNIREDRSELNDLSASHPEKLLELKTLFEAEGHRVRFFPSKWHAKN